MTTYHLVTNSVQPQQVRETADAYVIEGVPFVRPMQLSGGYVPEESIKETAPLWDGTPATLQHARDSRGQPIAANRKPEIHLGIAEDPEFDGEYVRANIRIAKDRLDAVDGADAVREKLESGDPISVSSQYAARDLPPGEYDGQMRENVEAIVRPDSIAILPNQRGQCSLEDGCGIDPQLVANAEVHVPMTHHANAQHGEDMDMDAAASPRFDTGDLVAWDWSGGTAQGRVAEVFDGEGTITRTFDGTEVTKDSDEAPVYLVDVWRGDGYSGQALRQEGERGLEAWSDPPAEATANASVPDEYHHDNPGEAMEQAQELGFDAIHTHGEGPDTVFMPGPSHEALVQTLRERGALSANATAYELTNVAPDNVDEWTDDEWDGDAAVAAMPNPSEDEDAADALDQTHAAVPADDEARDAKSSWKLPFRRGPDAPVNTRALVAIDAALSGARGGVEGLSDETASAISDWVDEMLAAAPDDLFGAAGGDDQSANAIERIGRQVLDTLGLAGANVADTTATANSVETTPAESGADAAETHSATDDPTDESGSTMDNRQELIDDITANSAISAASLEDACDERVELLHDDIMTANDDDDADGDLSRDDVREIVEDVVANAQTDEQKDDLAREIVANSAEYDDPEAVKDDYPTEAALETKRDQVTDGIAAPVGGGMEANVGGDDGPDFDVSAGTLGGGE